MHIKLHKLNTLKCIIYLSRQIQYKLKKWMRFYKDYRTKKITRFQIQIQPRQERFPGVIKKTMIIKLQQLGIVFKTSFVERS